MIAGNICAAKIVEMSNAECRVEMEYEPETRVMRLIYSITVLRRASGNNCEASRTELSRVQ